MMALLPNPELLTHLQTALLHSLWQGFALGLALYLLLNAIPANRPNLRYALSLAALVLLVLAVPLTWGALAYEPSSSVEEINAYARTLSDRAMPTTRLPAAEITNDVAATVTPAGVPKPPGPTPASRTLFIIWIAGVVLMLVRAWRLHAGAERLCRESPALDDEGIRTLIATLREELGIAREITVRVSATLRSPAVAGLLSPTLLLPAQMITGLPADQLRALLAHELAHIRRYDYLINFVQYIVEALLYFNPAVWWISRQIRIEREACCDAVAVSLTGAPATYADALAHLGRGLRTAAQYAHGDGTPSTLSDRIRRLLVPDYRPRLRWYGLAFAMATSTLGLILLYTGSFAFAGWILSDEERIATIEQVLETHTLQYDNTGDYDDIPEATIAGTVRSYTGDLILSVTDDQELPKCHITANVSRGNHHISHGDTLRNGKFRMKVKAGVVTLFARMEGYGPVVMPSFEVAPDDVRDDIELVLPEAVPTFIHFEDEAGNPVTDVEVGGFYKVTDNTGIGGFEGDIAEYGRFVFAQSADPIGLTINVASPGFAPEQRRDLEILPGTTYTWVLRESTPITARIIDQATGAPIVDAQISHIAEIHRAWIDAERGATLLATTAEDGTFELPDMNLETGHLLQVRAQGYGSDYLIQNVGVMQLGDFAMGPRRDIRGTVSGDLTRLQEDPKSGRPIIEGGIQIEHQPLLRFRAFVGEDGGFTFRDVPRGKFRLYSNALSESLQVTESIDDLVLSIPELLPTREVVLRLVPPPGAPVPTGTMTVSTIDQQQRYMRDKEYPIEDGVVRLPVPVPSSIRIGIGSIPGYYPEVSGSPYNKHIDIPAGTTELSLDIPLKRSGAIYGELFDADGAPFVGDFQAGIGLEPEHSSELNNVPNEANHAENGNRFVCAPLPLGYRYYVSISAGLTWLKSDWITLSTRAPVENIELRLPEGIDLPVRVVDPAGAPVGGATLTLVGDSRSHRGFVTDGNGRYVFNDVNPDYSPEYWVEVDPIASFAGARVSLNLDGTETVVQLRDGVVLRGSVVEEGTGKPVAGIRVAARPMGDSYSTPVETTSNAQGNFEFAGLNAVKHYLSVYGEDYQILYGENGEAPAGTGGQAEAVVITVRR